MMWAVLDRASNFALVLLVVFGAVVLAWMCGYDERPLSRRAKRRIRQRFESRRAQEQARADVQQAITGWPAHAPGDDGCGLCREIAARERAARATVTETDWDTALADLLRRQS